MKTLSDHNKIIRAGFVNGEPIWVVGATRSGKTAYLVNHFAAWAQATTGGDAPPHQLLPPPSAVKAGAHLPGVLVLAAIGDNRIELVDRLTAAAQGKIPFYATTPIGFFQDEVFLFWSLLIQQLDLKAQFPMRLAPENEQELATQLWQPEIDRAIGQQSTLTESRLVRRLLDLLQLCTLAGLPLQDVPLILDQGLAGPTAELPIPTGVIGELLQRWQTWCLERGLLTYGIIAGLYLQHLLPHPTYQQHLTQRYQLVLADDVDEYPAIARQLFEPLMAAGIPAVFTYNPDGAVRLGLGADPVDLGKLADRCHVVELTHRPVPCVGDELGESVVDLVMDPIFFASLPDTIQTLQTTSRAQLLRRTAETIVAAVQHHSVQPCEIAVIAPGLDAIAQYSLAEILMTHQIPVAALNDQRPLTGSPIIRALLTLLTLVYPGLGRLVERDAVAEMLVVLSQPLQSAAGATNGNTQAAHTSLIDPVRAGLLADYCFAPHPDRPRLLPANVFPRWDRLGYQATTAYQDMRQWIETQQSQLEQRLIPNAIALLDRAIQHFLLGGATLPFAQLAALRQLIESAQHYWDVDSRLRHRQRFDAPAATTVSRFIQLLRSGAVTANPYPVRPIGPASNAVLLANVFQYRSSRRSHRWQFWLDAGSPRWLNGVDALFAAPLFLHEWSGRPWTAADTLHANERRLRRILLDLLGRAAERVFLCYSDLATNGQEQTGVLLSLVNAATSLDAG